MHVYYKPIVLQIIYKVYCWNIYFALAKYRLSFFTSNDTTYFSLKFIDMAILSLIDC